MASLSSSKQNWMRFTSWLSNNCGAASAEFGMFAPLFVFGCLTMSDIGLAIHQRMTLDHVVRAGAQIAMADPGEDGVMSALRNSASQNFAIDGDSRAQTIPDPVSLEVARYCSCPDNRGVPTSCSDPCSGSTPPFVFYRMTAAKTYDGVIIPSLRMSSDINVQLR